MSGIRRHWLRFKGYPWQEVNEEMFDDVRDLVGMHQIPHAQGTTHFVSFLIEGLVTDGDITAERFSHEPELLAALGIPLPDPPA